MNLSLRPIVARSLLLWSLPVLQSCFADFSNLKPAPVEPDQPVDLGDASPGPVTVDAAVPEDCLEGEYRLTGAGEAQECMAWTLCPAGTFVVREGDAHNDRLCAACPSGTFNSEENALGCDPWTLCEPGEEIASKGTAESDRTCRSCPSNTFSSTANAVECQGWQECGPGTFVAVEPGPRNDSGCAGCPSGTYSGDSGVLECLTKTTCPPGQFVKDQGSAVTDRVCEPCPEGEDSFTPNSGACSPPGQCPPGTVTISSGASPECEACEAGFFCAGGDNPAEQCADGTWDSDSYAATPCEQQIQCPPGQEISNPGSATTARECEDCPAEHFSSTTDAISCVEWTSCSAGTFVEASGSSTSDRACAACASGTYSATANTPACDDWSVCASPTQHMTAAPTATQDRQCATCNAGTTSSDNQSMCAGESFRMSNDQVMVEAEHYQAISANGNSETWVAASLGPAANGWGMQLGSDDGGMWNTPGTGPRLDYVVEITSTGTFYLSLRADAGPQQGNSDSCFVGVNGDFIGDFYDFPEAPNTFGWVSAPFEVDVPGLHLISVWGREDGFYLDKLILRKDPALPVGYGPDESPFN